MEQQMEAKYLAVGDVIAPLTTDEPAVVTDVITCNGIYGPTTTLKYRYLGQPVTVKSFEVRVSANSMHTVLTQLDGWME